MTRQSTAEGPKACVLVKSAFVKLPIGTNTGTDTNFILGRLSSSADGWAIMCKVAKLGVKRI